MTEAVDGIQIEEALQIIDSGLGDFIKRDLLTSSEVADLLLDLRSVLTFVPVEPAQPASSN
ncbi:MAG: hypothetical protein KTU85_03440 [Acidimicrobiia bacterium]|nr:hypothetical protein [Acidimicrobiia bacterium]MCY4456500.1 hypothetical protein [Acidimicrobiaceae bacterium]